MHGSYRVTKRSASKPLDPKSWNVSTRVDKRGLPENYLASLRQSPDLKKSNFYSQKYSPEPRAFQEVPSEARSRNYSYNKIDSSNKIMKSSYVNNKIRSLAFKKDLDRKYKVPNFVAHAIAEIFTTTNKEPVGLAILVAEKLILTSHNAIPNERFASRCIFRFINDKVYYKPKSEKFFYTSSQFSLTITGVSRVRKDVAKKFPLRIEGSGDVKLGDVLFCAESTCFRVQVTNLDQDSYGISSHFTPISGSPVFNSTWSLVGMAHTTSMTYKYTECSSLESIFSILSYIRSRYNIDISQVNLEKTQEIEQAKNLKWFEFNGEYVEVFDIGSGEWRYNRSAFNFLWHSAVVAISDDESLVVGGIRRELAVDEVYKYNSRTNEVLVMANMGVSRAFCAAVFYDNLVFAIGGKFANTFCEKYFIEEDRWEFIPSMLHERYDLSAVVLNHTIYVIGGEPRKFFGNLIEKFDILREIWEEVPTRLPFAISCSPVCIIDNFACGILGGRGSRSSFIMEVSKFQSNDVSIKEGADLSEEIESIYPAVFSKQQKKIYILNTAEGFDRPVLYKIHSSYLPL
jgi:hypothetical protein